MKKMTAVVALSILASLLIMTCSVDPQGYANPEELLSEQTRVLAEDGKTIFDDTIKDHANVKNSEIADSVEAVTDYMLFPVNYDIVNFDTQKSFDERMKDMYYADDNVIQIYNFIKDPTADASGATRGVEGVIDFLGTTADVLESVSDVISPVNAICSGISSIVSIFGGGSDSKVQKKLEKMDAKLNAISGQISGLDMKIDEFRAAMNQEFSKLNSKVDHSIELQWHTRKDINLLSQQLTEVESNLGTALDTIRSDIYYSNFITTKSNIDGYLGDLSTQSSHTVQYALNVINEYGALMQNYLNFIEQLHDVAVAATYTGNIYNADYIADDDDESIKVIKAVITHGSGTATYYLKYTNPRKSVPISLGDFEYLSKFMLMRFVLNELTNEDPSLDNKNTALSYINELDTRYKTELEAAMLTMNTEYLVHKQKVLSGFTGDYSGITSVEYYANGELIDDMASVGSDEYQDQLERLVKSSYISSSFDYLTLLYSEFLTLKIQLNAYIEAGNR
jgi:hypothetical protein